MSTRHKILCVGLISVFAVMLFASLASAQLGVWMPKNDGLWGAWPSALAISPDGGTVYSGVQGGVYRSTDGGDSWERILGNTIKALAINPQTPSTIYAGTEGNGIYRTTDGGDSWEQINNGLTNPYVYSLAINPVTPSTVYAGTDGGGVHRSTDGGDNWEQIISGLANLDVRALAINPITSTTIYAGTGDGAYQSTDGGDNWEQKKVGLINTDVRSLAINPETPTIIFVGTGDGVYRSENEGDEWTRIGSDMIGGRVKALAIDPQSSSIIYAGAFCRGVFKSADGGDNWTESLGYCVNTLAINPLVPSTIYAGCNAVNGLFKSTDGGDNWTPTSLLVTPILALSINPSDLSIIYVGTMNGLFRSVNGGNNWTRTECDIYHIRAIAINPQSPNIIYAGGDSGGGFGYVYRSTDGEASWEDITNGIITETFYALATATNPDFPDTIYAGTAHGIYRSMDGGETWENITNGISPDVRAIAINPDFPDIIYAGTDGGVFRSTDGGDNWEWKGLANPGVMALAINPASPDIIYAGTRGTGVYRSMDGGDNWKEINLRLSNGGSKPFSTIKWCSVGQLAINPGVPSTIYAGTWRGVYRSENSGDNWEEINQGLTNLDVNALAINPRYPEPSTIYAGIGRDGVFAADYMDQLPPITLISPNGREVWSRGSSHSIIWKTSIPGIDHIRLLYSTDGGNTYPNTIVDNTADDGVYEWSPVPSLDSGTARVKAIAEDSIGAMLAEDASDGNFTLGAPLPQTIYVAITGDDATGDGSAAKPYRTIQKGIDEAYDGCTVLVADGTYGGVGNVNLEFRGKAITVKSENGAEECIIDCENASDTRGFYFRSGEDSDSVVDGFTIRNGNAQFGGGICCINDSSPEITNNIIIENSAPDEDINNRGGGGGIYCSSSSPRIAYNTIVGNLGFLGGGIRCYDNSGPMIVNNMIMRNEGEKAGGGIHCADNSLPRIENNIITENWADFGGGICCRKISSPTITNNIITENYTEPGPFPGLQRGGGIYCDGESSPEITNNTIIANSAGTLDDPGFGGGIYCRYGAYPIIKNTILWGNSPEEIYLGKDGSINVTYSDIQGGWAGEGNIDDDPLFVNPDPANGDYHLRYNSPCIGAGTLDPNMPDTDIEGSPRPNPPGSKPDMGAYENSLGEPLEDILVVEVRCPVDLVVTDREGQTISKESSTIPLARYTEMHLDGDGDLDDQVIIPDPLTGNYSIEVIPEPDAVDTDTYSLRAIAGGTTIVSAENVQIDDIPDQPYMIRSTEEGIVLAAPTIIDLIITQLQTIIEDNPGTPLADKLGDALAKAQTALDELTKMPSDNQAAAGSIEGAVGDLEAAIKDGFFDPEQGTEFIDQFATAARQLATDAIVLVSDPHIKAEAQQSLDQGDALRESGAFKDAINKYKDALAKAESALAAPALVEASPEEPGLAQNYPNPFNPNTWIPYKLAEDVDVAIRIYGVAGHLIRTLNLGHKPAGFYTTKDRAAYWDGRNEAGEQVSSGVYFYTIQVGDYIATRKMVVAK